MQWDEYFRKRSDEEVNGERDEEEIDDGDENLAVFKRRRPITKQRWQD